MHSNFECISGDCKNGFGVIKASDMYIIGRIESKQLNGEATILYLQDAWRT